jgi:hypothetical protein
MSKLYRKKANPIEMDEWKPGDEVVGVSVSETDRQAGSPKAGDMIARNPENADDRWLVSKAYFEKNYEAEEE